MSVLQTAGSAAFFPEGARRVRVVVVDEDPRLHQFVARVLRAPEFQVFFFSDPHCGLVRLTEIAPDVIVCAASMRALDGRTFQSSARSAPPLRPVPFLFLEEGPAGHRNIEPALGPKDDYLRKPFTAGEILFKVRGLVASEPSPVTLLGRATPSLAGEADRSGLFALVRLIEEARLTGRFTLTTTEGCLWVDWLAGAAVAYGRSPEDDGGEPLELLLAEEGGRYGFMAQPVAPFTGAAEAESGAAASPADGASAKPPVGRFTDVRVNGRTVQILTEGANTPNFEIVTVVASGGLGVRRVESAWRHPLKRAADHRLANEEIHRQHESVVGMVNDGIIVPQSRRTVWDVAGGGVEGDLLIWVISLLRSMAAERLGTLPALTLLRRALRRSTERLPALREFRVKDDGAIELPMPQDDGGRRTLSGWRLPKGAVEGVAGWAEAFLTETEQFLTMPTLPSLREATRLRAGELEAIGFYPAPASRG